MHKSDYITTPYGVYEFRRGVTGFSVDRKVFSKEKGLVLSEQLFWSENYNIASAFFKGVYAAISSSRSNT